VDLSPLSTSLLSLLLSFFFLRESVRWVFVPLAGAPVWAGLGLSALVLAAAHSPSLSLFLCLLSEKNSNTLIKLDFIIECPFLL
jgi:hypothetical protein